MRPSRRQFLSLAATAALPLAPRIAWWQAYPNRPVRILVASPPGGTADFLARIMGQWLSERLGQPFVTENRSGAATIAAAEAVANAAPDGHTLLLINPAHVLNATLYDKLKFNFARDIAPVAGLVRAPNVMGCTPRFRPRPFPNSSPMPKPTPARSIMRRPAPERCCMSRASCSR